MRVKRYTTRKKYRKICRLKRRAAKDRLKNPEWWDMMDWLEGEMFKRYITELERAVLYGEGGAL